MSTTEAPTMSLTDRYLEAVDRREAAKKQLVKHGRTLREFARPLEEDGYGYMLERSFHPASSPTYPTWDMLTEEIARFLQARTDASDLLEQMDDDQKRRVANLSR